MSRRGACGGFFREPIGKTAVADFAVTPGTDAGVDIEAVLGAKLNKFADVAIARPIELPLGFLVVNPDAIHRDDGDAAGFHFDDFIFPFAGRAADVMEFAHDGHPGLAA